jgi:O-antigen/teichoic acid export membrane protein
MVVAERARKDVSLEWRTGRDPQGRDDPRERDSPLALWQRATVINAILLFPVAALVTRYAQPLVVAVFGVSYRPAALVMQIYMLVLIRECFDFAPALRAINKTRPLVESNVAALATCALALFALIPAAGVAGAMAAFVIASFTDVTWLGFRTMRSYRVGLGDLVPWGSIGKTGLAAILACVLVLSSVWTDMFGVAGVLVAAAVYGVGFVLLLLAMRVPEALVLLEWVKRLALRDTSQARP